MAERIEDQHASAGDPLDPSDDDERVGEAVEDYLALAEQGQAPDVDAFVARYAGLEDEVRAALEGLELVHGLMGLGSATGSGSGRGRGWGQRIESGRRIAGYRVVRELGRGGMGTVYEAVHVGLDRPVALKVLGMHAAPDSSARRRFLNEARTAAGLHHTHIVPVFDVGQVGGLCYYAMQRIEGSGLDCVVRHMRASRRVAGDGAAGSRSLAGELYGASAAGVHSAIGRIWGRVSSGWHKRPRAGGVAEGPAPNGPALSVLPFSQVARGPGKRASSVQGDSTASWGPDGEHAPVQDRPNRDGTGGIACAAASLDGTGAGNPRGELEPPPFDPAPGPGYFRWVAELGLQAADALAHAHHQGVIHRDVKPSNLLVDAKGNVWVTDFGLARRLADPGLTHHDSLLGTPRYMSPEQARTGSIDGRTDVYSLGATLYELLTLRPPFDGRTAAELVEQIGQQDPVAPSLIDKRVPRDLETIVLKALAKRPADRYTTAAELAEDLTRYLNREPVRARRISPFGRLWRVAYRHPGITIVTSAAAAAILAIATVAYLRVVSAYNQELISRTITQEALQREKAANSKERDARKENLLSTVELVGLSGTPNRRSHGLELIGEAVALEPEDDLRAKLRDWAVRFLVLREVETRQPDLQTGRARGLVFSPSGTQLAVLSEDDEELSLWDISKRRRMTTLSLRVGEGGLAPIVAEPSAVEAAGGGRVDPSGAQTAGSGSARGGLPVSGPRRGGNRVPAQRMATTGQFVATLLPGDRGLALIDLLPGVAPRILNPPDRAVLSVVGDASGRRLVTIEQAFDGTPGPATDGPRSPEGRPPRIEYQVNLWDPDHLDQPIAKLEWTRQGPPGRPEWTPPPLVAIGPDGKTVAVAAFRDKFVRLFSGVDGRSKQRGEKGLEIDTQTELGALALGPNEMLATAGTTSGGATIRVWDLDSSAVPNSLTPSSQSFTRFMRFSPHGTLLAIAGVGPIELWDPVAHSLVAVLPMDDQATDLAFAADGRTLAATGHSATTSVWTVRDSVARTQLSGFDSAQSSLAFGPDGVLAGSGRDGVWFWRSGRCPEMGPPAPDAPTPSPELARAEPSGRVPGRKRDGERERERDREHSRPSNPQRIAPPVLAYDSQGRLLAHDAQGLRIWPAGSNPARAPIQQLNPRQDSMARTPMSKSQDGSIMVMGRQSEIFLWRAESPGKMVPVVPPPHSGAASAADAAIGPRRGAGSGGDARPRQIRAVAIAPRGDRIYMIEQAGPMGLLRAWSLANPGETGRLHAHDLNWTVPLSEGVVNLALRPDGEILAVADRAGTVSLIDTSRCMILSQIKPPGNEGETFWLPLAFSPSGRELALGSQNGAISLWTVAQPTHPSVRLRLPAHRGLVGFLAFDPKGGRIASAGFGDPLVEVWDLDFIERELARLGLTD